MKGSILDFLFIFIFLLIFAISTIVGSVILSNYADMSSNLGVSNISISQAQTTIANLDYVFIFITFGMAIAVVVGAFMIRTHPVFFVISLFGLLFIILISGQLANVYLEFAQNAQLISTAANYPYMELIFQNLPLITAVFGIIVAIVAYSKIRSSDGFD